VSRYDRSADVVLVGFASVGALLPEAAGRFDVEFATIGGGLTRIGDTPVGRFRLGVRGERADAALAWVAERGGHVTHTARGPQGIAAA
jgi:D-methionine transport system ATP-binding protein